MSSTRCGKRRTARPDRLADPLIARLPGGLLGDACAHGGLDRVRLMRGDGASDMPSGA